MNRIPEAPRRPGGLPEGERYFREVIGASNFACKEGGALRLTDEQVQELELSEAKAELLEEILRTAPDISPAEFDSTSPT